MDHYVVLGIPRDADDELIRSAFRALVRRYHPDAGEGSSPDKFRLLVEAYEALSDPVRRRRYDESLRGVSRAPFPVDPVVAPSEPLVPQRPHAGSFYAESRPSWTSSPFEEIFARLWRGLEEDFFSRPFRPRW